MQYPKIKLINKEETKEEGIEEIIKEDIIPIKIVGDNILIDDGSVIGCKRYACELSNIAIFLNDLKADFYLVRDSNNCLCLMVTRKEK